MDSSNVREYTLEEMVEMFAQAEGRPESQSSQQGTSSYQASSSISRSSSYVWLYFEKVSQPQSQIFNCICKICRMGDRVTKYAYSTNGGTGTLSRHLSRAHDIVKDKAIGEVRGTGANQTQLEGYMSELPGGGMSSGIL